MAWRERGFRSKEFPEETSRRRGVWHGLTVIWGPTGSGKSALANALIWRHCFRPGLRCLGRSCGDKSCREEWTVYTNSQKLKGPSWERDGVSVVQDIETIIPQLMAKKDIGHALLYLEEFQEWMDSRRSSSRGNIVISYIFAQLRKAKTIAYATTPNFTLIDKRAREIAKRDIRVYNPDEEAINVGGVVREQSIGYLHPRALEEIEDEDMMFFIKPYRDLYDTHETFKQPKFFSPSARVNVVTVSEKGRGKNKTLAREVVPMSFTQLVNEGTLYDLIAEHGVHKIAPAELLAKVYERWRVALDEAKLDVIMQALDYPADDEGNYLVGVDPDAVLEGVS